MMRWFIQVTTDSTVLQPVRWLSWCDVWLAGDCKAVVRAGEGAGSPLGQILQIGFLGL